MKKDRQAEKISALAAQAKLAQLKIEWVALETRWGLVKAAYKVAYGTLEATKQSAFYAIGEGGKIITKNVLDLVQINKVEFEGKASDIIGGLMPRLTLQMTILGKPRQLNNVQFDFNNPKKSADAIAQAVVKFFK